MKTFLFLSAGILLGAIFVALRHAHLDERRAVLFFHAALETVGQNPEVLDEFDFPARSWEEAMFGACQILKEHSIYKSNDYVPSLVEILELGEEFSSAGYEFPELPEAMRHVRLDIRPQGSHSLEDSSRSVMTDRRRELVSAVHSGCGPECGCCGSGFGDDCGCSNHSA